MSRENVAKVRRLYEEGIARGDRQAFEEVLAPDFAYHDPNWQVPVGDRDDYMRKGLHIASHWSELELTFDHVFAAGDHVAARGTFEGVWTSGRMHGVNATGRRARFAWITLFRLVDGRVAEAWDVFDHYGELRQLGVIARD